MPMEEAATTVPRSTRLRRRIIQVVEPITPMAVTTPRRAGTTHRRPGITNPRRAITISRGSINRRRATTNKRHGPITGRTRIAVGTATAGADGMDVIAAGAMTIAAVTVDATTAAAEAITMVAGVTAEAGIVDPFARHLKTAALIAPLFYACNKTLAVSVSSGVLGTFLHFCADAFVSLGHSSEV